MIENLQMDDLSPFINDLLKETEANDENERENLAQWVGGVKGVVAKSRIHNLGTVKFPSQPVMVLEAWYVTQFKPVAPPLRFRASFGK